jgi:hypothetical protein
MPTSTPAPVPRKRVKLTMTAFIGDDGIVHLTHGGNPQLHVHVSAKGAKMAAAEAALRKLLDA